MTRFAVPFCLAMAISAISGAPASAADYNITGTVVDTNNVQVGFGSVAFYATCADFAARKVPAAFVAFNDGSFQTPLPAGTYQVYILPTPRMMAQAAWNGGFADCNGSLPITVDANAAVTVITAAGDEDSDPAALAEQSLMKPAALKHRAKADLAKKTKQGARITWTSRTRKVCTVKRHSVRGKAKGVCRLSATAPAVPGFTALSKKYTLRVT